MAIGRRLRAHRSASDRMLTPLRVALRLAPGEGTKVLQFAGVGLLLQAGLAMGTNAADSLFLTHVGAENLPHIYLLTPVIMLAYVPLFSHLLRRHGMDRVFDGTLATLGVGGIGFWWAFSQQGDLPAIWLCYAAKLYAALWYIGLYNLFWSFIDGYFDLIDAKRLFSFFAAGSAIGAMLGGGLVLQLAERIGTAHLFLGWALLAGLCWPLLHRTRQRWRKIEVEDLQPAADQPQGLFHAALSGVRGLLHSRYALLLTSAIFLRLVAATVCDYQAMSVFSAGRDAGELATLFGRLTASVGVLNLVLTLLVFNQLVSRFGVRNVALLQPLVYGGVFAWLLLDHGFPAAVAGFFAYHGVMAAIEFNNVNLLFAGLPAAARKEIRTFIEGICEPSASAVAGVFLLAVGAVLSATQLSLAGLGVALAGFGVTLAVRRDYVSALAANLRRDWLDLSPAASAPAPAEGRPERSLSVEAALDALPSASGEARAALLETLRTTANASATTGVLKAAGNFTPWERRLAERLLVGFGSAAVPHLVEVAQSPHYSLRARSITLRALHQLNYPLLHAVATVLMEQTSLKAYAALAAHVALGSSREPGRATLACIYRDYPLLTVEIVLEALTVCGRLPPYEALVMALHSGLAKERGYAIETISQAAGRKLYERLAPWIEERPLEQQIAHGRARGWMPGLSADTVLRNALGSAFPLESAAAWQALAAERNPAHTPLLEAKLATFPHPLLQETAAMWRRREKGDADGSLTPVERVQALMRAPAFTGFDFTHFEFLAPHLREESLETGRTLVDAGAVCPAAWLVLNGELVARSANATRSLRAGDVAGAATLHGDSVSQVSLTAKTLTRVLTVPRRAVLDCAETFSALGLNLLRRMFVR